MLPRAEWMQTLWAQPLVHAAAWSLATIVFYLLAKRLYRRWPRWWLMPLAVAPALLMVAALALHESYGDYIRGTGWLVGMLGPATVAFAVPIYELCRQLPVTCASVLSTWPDGREFSPTRPRSSSR